MKRNDEKKKRNFMTVKLTHVFKDKLPDVDEFFKTKDGHINTINGMCSRIKGLAKKYSIPTPNQSLIEDHLLF